MKKKAILAGATGLVGGFCLKELLQDKNYAQVTLLVRKQQPLKLAKLKQLVVDFDYLEKYAKQLKADDVFCALGTTRKKSPTFEAYQKIEFSYPFKLAQLTLKNKAKTFSFVSSVGADANSRAEYLRLKGETEEVLSGLPFKAVHLMRPSFILGEEGRGERQPMEKIMEVTMEPLGFLFAGPLAKYHPIPASRIAKAMVAAARQNLTGAHVWEYPLLDQLAD